MIDFTNINVVFLDRDGVLNCKPLPGQYITSAEDLVVLPGVVSSVARLNRSGRKVIVVTNQRGIALGLYSPEELQRIHEKLIGELAAGGAHLDRIYFCPHDNQECNCRKPDIGMFEQAFRDYPDASAGRCVMVGDSLRDIEAGVRAGIFTAFVTDDAEKSSDHSRATLLADLTVGSLVELVERYLCPPAVTLL